MLHGEGFFRWTNLVTYTGEFSYNSITGVGEYHWPDKSYYKGDVKNGLRHGKGTFTAPKETAKYTGDWEIGLRHGNGKIEFSSGAIFEG